MKLLRTPDDRFEGLPDFPFEPHYAELDGGIRVHHLDEGPRDAPPVLLMHGEPTWCFLYRKVVPTLVDAGYRVVAPDLVGFGRSDKPSETSDYSYARHVDWMAELLFGHLDLRDITYFGQDWGALVGLRLVAREPERYGRVVIGNGGMPTGEGTPTEAFLRWQQFAATVPELPVGHIVKGGCAQPVSDDVVAAYDAPFPDETYKAGARIFPSLVPTTPEDPAHDDQVEAWKVLSAFEKPFLCAFSDSDPITKGGERAFLNGRVKGAEGQPHTTIEGGGHFLQEDRGEELGRVIAQFIARTSA
jgi:haloalkane dehalogenase